MTKLLRQNHDLLVREVERHIFLIDEDGGTIHHLNETASAIWRLLAQPANSKAIVQEFRFLYPDEDVKFLKKSIQELLWDLTDRNILIKEKKS